mmetsp:Transcript_26802/g.53861  ORF Transcript_26802/g.53861 Transcript_26802/m.53861 type:complete len:213 (-) Transcript_26802:104-742(-)
MHSKTATLPKRLRLNNIRSTALASTICVCVRLLPRRRPSGHLHRATAPPPTGEYMRRDTRAGGGRIVSSLFLRGEGQVFWRSHHPGGGALLLESPFRRPPCGPQGSGEGSSRHARKVPHPELPPRYGTLPTLATRGTSSWRAAQEAHLLDTGQAVLACAQRITAHLTPRQDRHSWTECAARGGPDSSSAARDAQGGISVAHPIFRSLGPVGT